ncbi:MAG: hypothetical protein ACQGVC_13330 [Myxococcota bacterium]
MPEDAPTTRTEQTQPPPDAYPTAEAPGGTNLGLVALFVAIVVLVAVQNLWLRRRAEREARGDVPRDPEAG